MIVGVNGSDSVGELVARVIVIRDNIIEFKCNTTLTDPDTTACRIVRVVILRDDIGRGGVTNLKKLVVGVVLPAGGQTIGVGERGLEDLRSEPDRYVHSNEFVLLVACNEAMRPVCRSYPSFDWRTPLSA